MSCPQGLHDSFCCQPRTRNISCRRSQLKLCKGARHKYVGISHRRSRSTIGYPQKLLTGSLDFCIKDGGRLQKPVANRIRSTSIEVPDDRCNEQASFAVDWERFDTLAWCHWVCLFLIAYCSPWLTAAVTVPGILLRNNLSSL